jgi:hypothetical protein
MKASNGGFGAEMKINANQPGAMAYLSIVAYLSSGAVA